MGGDVSDANSQDETEMIISAVGAAMAMSENETDTSGASDVSVLSPSEVASFLEELREQGLEFQLKDTCHQIRSVHCVVGRP